MERIMYRKTLDVHKNGIQFTLQGFETADNMSRRIEISLMASGDTIDFPLEQITAVMYVTTPNASEPSINECIIKDNTIIYDVLPIVEEGITEMQLKLIETRPDGANGVLAAPKFAAEVSKSNTDDESVTQTTTYTALEDALAKAKGVYDARLLRMEIDSDCMFRVYYADGTTYETDALKETLLKGEALLSQSYARGGSGVRDGEDTDNSMYYSNVSRSAAEEADRVSGEATELLEEVTKHGVYTAFSVNFETGEVEYISPQYKFDLNEKTGELDAIGETYNPEDSIEYLVNEWLQSKNAEIELNMTEVNKAIADVNSAIAEETEKRQAEILVERERIDTLETTVETHTTQITDLQDAQNSLSSSFVSMGHAVSENTSKISDIETHDTEQDVNIEKLQQDLNTANTKLETTDSNISSLQSAVSELDARFIITADSTDERLQTAAEGTVWIQPLE